MPTEPGHAPAAEDYSALIRSGRHAGAAVALGPGHYMVGRADDADIVLTDDGIADAHAELHLRNGTCSLRPVGGAVQVAGRPLAGGARVIVPLPTDITLDGVRITVSATQALATPPGRRPSRLRRLALVAGGAVLVAGALGAAVPSSHGTGGAPLAAATAGPAAAAPSGPVALMRAGLSLTGLDFAAPAAEPVPEAADAAAGPAEPATAASAMADRLREAGLAGLVRVQAGAGVVEARGAVRPESEGAWTGAQAWFDKTYRGRIALVSEVRVEEGAAAIPSFAIQSIWAGAGAYVIASNGEKYGVGARLPGGWAIETIERDTIVVSRQGERVSLVP